MEKSIKTTWNTAFIKEQELIVPKINNLYTQKSQSIISRIQRTYEIDNKGLIPMAILVAVGMILFSEAIIGLYAAFLIVCLYVFNSRLLQRFKTIDVNSDNLSYLKTYRDVINSVMSASKKLFMYAIPLAILSIFGLSLILNEHSFLSQIISKDMSAIKIIAISTLLGAAISVLGFAVFKLSTQLLYGRHILRLNDIIKDIEVLNE